MIKSKENSKFYIEQFIINNYEDFQEFWTDVKAKIDLSTNSIIGYLYCYKEPAKVLNLYLINKQYYNGADISAETLDKAWKSFSKSHSTICENPPIEKWINTKLNWCKKLATKLSNGYNISFDEALSEVYLAVMRCYCKGTVYMGNLGYIHKAVYSQLNMRLRHDKVFNQPTLSLNTVMTDNQDDEPLTIGDLIAAPEDMSQDLEYNELVNRLKTLLSDSFSKREIEQIMNCDTSLPRPLYRRLFTWRQKHSKEELYE